MIFFKDRSLHLSALAKVLCAVACAIVPAGCQSLKAGNKYHGEPLSYRDPETGIQVERGRPIPIVDKTGWVLGTPTKLALWDRRSDNHDISPQTEAALLRFMDQNHLNHSLVRINQYDPWGEWKRLATNKRIGAGWRYTVGAYNLLEYTLLPGRLIGGDWYNPYTDTTYIFSDIAPLAISRTAYAIDVEHRDYPGTYAVTQDLPFIGIVHETITTRTALQYSKEFGSEAEQAEAHRILAPDYGSTWGGQIVHFIPLAAPLGRLAGAGVGHAANGVRQLLPGNRAARPSEPTHQAAVAPESKSLAATGEGDNLH